MSEEDKKRPSRISAEPEEMEIEPQFSTPQQGIQVPIASPPHPAASSTDTQLAPSLPSISAGVPEQIRTTPAVSHPISAGPLPQAPQFSPPGEMQTTFGLRSGALHVQTESVMFSQSPAPIQPVISFPLPALPTTTALTLTPYAPTTFWQPTSSRPFGSEMIQGRHIQDLQSPILTSNEPGPGGETFPIDEAAGEHAPRQQTEIERYLQDPEAPSSAIMAEPRLGPSDHDMTGIGGELTLEPPQFPPLHPSMPPESSGLDYPGASEYAALMVREFQSRLEDLAIETDQRSMTVLIRNALSVRGVKMQRIRCELHPWYMSWKNRHPALTQDDEKQFALLLFQSEWFEDKLAAILFIHEVLLQGDAIHYETDLARFEAIFRGGHIKVSKICDNFAEKVLTSLVHKFGDEMLDRVFAWTEAEDMWQARAGLCALVPFAPNAIHHPRMIEATRRLLIRREDEAKSIAGTALRAISAVDPLPVLEFLNQEENIVHATVTSLSKAIARLSREQMAYFRELRRDAIARRR